MFYKLMRIITRLAFKAYFRKIYLVNREHVPLEGPVLFAPNHPSAFMEACLLACFQPRTLHFLVRGDVFENPKFRPFLSATNQVPIFRARDGFKNLRKNDETFRFVYETLEQHKVVVIFPESRTIWEKRLRKVQKGAAKMAFGALERVPDMPLKIIPIGVNFEDPRKFHSDVVIKFGEAIDVQEYARDAGHDMKNAIEILTSDIESGLNKLVYQLDDEVFEQHFNMSQIVLRSHLDKERFPNVEISSKRFEREMNLAKELNNSDPKLLKAELDTFRRPDQNIIRNTRLLEISQQPLWKQLLNVLPSTPLWILGLVLTGLPGWLAGRITHQKVKDNAFIGPVKIGLSMLFYLAYFSIITILLVVIYGWLGMLIGYCVAALAYFVARTHEKHIDSWTLWVNRLKTNWNWSEMETIRLRLLEKFRSGQ